MGHFLIGELQMLCPIFSHKVLVTQDHLSFLMPIL